MESTSLDDVLYRYASFRNLVDPITHDLIISLARYIHCPKPVGRLWSEPARSRGVRWVPFRAEQLYAQRGQAHPAGAKSLRCSPLVPPAQIGFVWPRG